MQIAPLPSKFILLMHFKFSVEMKLLISTIALLILCRNPFHPWVEDGFMDVSILFHEKVEADFKEGYNVFRVPIYMHS